MTLKVRGGTPALRHDRGFLYWFSQQRRRRRRLAGGVVDPVPTPGYVFLRGKQPDTSYVTLTGLNADTSYSNLQGK